MKTRKILFLSVLTLLISCSSTKKGKTLFINAETHPCQAGVMEKECLLVKYSKDQNQWEFFYNEIEGFKYEKGYEYELLVKEENVANPPADGSSLRYILIKEVKKEKKD